MALLSVEELRAEFGGIVALADLSFTVEAGQICALIGPNGAGKTTLFNCVSRLYEPKAGRITFDGRDLLALPAHGIARAGIARTFQNLALFPALTVLDNVLVGGYSRKVARGKRRAEAMEILERLSLADLAHAVVLVEGLLAAFGQVGPQAGAFGLVQQRNHASPTRPAGICFSPIWMSPRRNVPVVRTTAPVEISRPSARRE